MPRKRKNSEAESIAATLMGGGLPPDSLDIFAAARSRVGTNPVAEETAAAPVPVTLGDETVRAHRLATLGTLAASLAHEVNNILTPVLSYAQLALASPEDAELTRKALLRAVDCTAKAAQIGSAMLGFVRVEGLHSGSTGCSVVQTVSDAVACLGRDMSKDGVELRCRIDPGHMVAMDHVSLQQVVLNLLLNAREALRGRRGAIEIESLGDSGGRPFGSPSDGGGPAHPANAPARSTGNITLRIRDTGPGMRPDLVERLFTPFVSSRSSVPGGSERTTGTGLGLSVCRFLIERAGGRIGVASRLGEGTTFEIVLPAAASVARAVAA